MLGVGVSPLGSADRRSCFGWRLDHLTIGLLTLLDWNTMVDYTGYAALIF